MGTDNMLQRALRRLAQSNEELESEDLQKAVQTEGAVPIRTCEDRQVVNLTGTVSTLTIAPRAGHPALEVELRDGSGAVTLVARHGRIAHLEAQGLMDIESRKPMQKDAIFRIMSMTKPVVGVSIMMMI